MDLGSKLKEVRRSKQITLQEVARETGLSKSFISQVEAGDANPSIGSLKKIADALAIPLAALFEAEPNGVEPSVRDRSASDRPNDVRVVRSDRRKMLVWPGENAKHYLISPDVQRKLEVTYNELQPGYDSGADMLSHPGEECGFVLEGVLEVTVGGTVFLLQTGDSIYFSSQLPHRERVVGDEGAKTFWVNTPPTY